MGNGLLGIGRDGRIWARMIRLMVYEPESTVSKYDICIFCEYVTYRIINDGLDILVYTCRKLA